MKKATCIKIDEYIIKELEEVVAMIKTTKSTFIRSAIIEKITRIKMGK